MLHARAVLASALVFVTTLPARAFEDQLHLGAGAGAAGFAAAGHRARPLLGGHVAYGWSDAFDVRGEALLVDQRDARGAAVTQRVFAAGVAYKLDVLEWIPYVGLLVGHYSFGAARPGGLGATELGVALPVGLDWAPTRELGAGVQLGYHGFPGALPSLGSAPYFSAAVRAEYRWGW